NIRMRVFNRMPLFTIYQMFVHDKHFSFKFTLKSFFSIMRYPSCFTKSIIVICFMCNASVGFVQFKPEKVNWTADGTGLYEIQDNMLLRINPLSAQQVTILATAAQLTPAGKNEPLKIADFEVSKDDNMLLIFTNTAKVWRYNTRGDYWVLNRSAGELKQIGKDKPAQSL